MSDSFGKIVVGGKATIITVLLAFSLVNAHKTYVDEHPRKFLLDSLFSGVVGGASSVLMCFTRGVPELAITYGLVGMLFFFFYNVCREFSGYFAFLGLEKTTAQEEREYKILKYPIVIIAGIAIISLVYFAILARIPPDMSFGILHNLPNSLAFIIEMLIIVGMFTASDTFVGYNHGERPQVAAISSAATFTLVHILLQFGGFYNTIYQ